ncbi:MAG: hypothetical protein WAV28_10785, partial [Sedimentisphaerales bacterium]
EYPEFRAWHALLEPLFEIKPPEWKKKAEPQAALFTEEETEEETEEKLNEEEDAEEEAES